MSAGQSLQVTGKPNESGLTLIEVLISLSLVVLILGVLNLFLYSGFRFQGKYDRAYERKYLLKSLYQVCRSDLASMVTGPYLPEASLVGNDYELSFWRESAAGLFQIKYRFDPQEKKLYRAIGFWESEKQETVLFEAIDDWKFEYFDGDSKNWVSEWSPELKEEIPALVGVSYQTAESGLIRIVFPIKLKQHKDNHDEN